MNDDYYTYQLVYPESMGGAVFYIGKGRDDRWMEHEWEARRGVQSRKCDIIREIWQHGEEVVREKVHEHLSEQEALKHEARLIDKYGLGGLSNRRRGHRKLIMGELSKRKHPLGFAAYTYQDIYTRLYGQRCEEIFEEVMEVPV